MKTTLDWIDEAERKLGLSDYAMAKRLGVSTAQMSRYRTRKQFLGESGAIKIAAMLEIDPLPILAAAAAERATTEDARAVWTRYAEALASVAGVAILGTVLLAPPSASAAGSPPTGNDGTMSLM